MLLLTSRLRWLLTIVSFLGVGCAPSVRAHLHDFDHGRVRASHFLGMQGDDRYVWLERLEPQGGAIVRGRLGQPVADTIARTGDALTTGWIGAVRDEYGWDMPEALGDFRTDDQLVVDDELTLAVVVDAPIASRRTLAIEARFGASRSVIGTLAVVRDAAFGPVYVVADHAVYRVFNGGVESFAIADLGAVRGTLENLEAIRALRTGDLARAAALLERAVARDPRSAQSIYNLACVHARGGDLDRAESELAIAIALENRRFSGIARTDDDLRVLRERTSVRQLIGLDD